MSRPAVQPLDPASPAGVTVTLALGDILTQLDEAVRAREVLATVTPTRRPRRAARTSKAA